MDLVNEQDDRNLLVNEQDNGNLHEESYINNRNGDKYPDYRLKNLKLSGMPKDDE